MNCTTASQMRFTAVAAACPVWWGLDGGKEMGVELVRFGGARPPQHHYTRTLGINQVIEKWTNRCKYIVATGCCVGTWAK